tara:strand:+ start:136 stop:351 length:216 start_codon:yes stop_codon:yes gene_type:complete
MKQLNPISALLIYLIILATYSFCVWQTAIVFYPVQQQIEINDWKKRCDKCHWQLLKANGEIENLKNEKQTK